MSVMSDIDLDRREYGVNCKALKRDLPTQPDPYKPQSVFRPKRPAQYDNSKIVMFARMIAPIATEATDFTRSFRIISMQNKRPKKRWHQKWADVDAVYQGYYTTQKGVERTPDYEDIINSIKFYRDKDYYITKNSFKSKHKCKLNTRTKVNESQLFSLDNIVIDVDLHKKDKNGHELQLTNKDAESIDMEILKLFRLLYHRPKTLPNFNFAVKTGRGVQLWLRLESCAAPMFQQLYHDICNKICAELQALLEVNGINLEVDFTASCDAARSVRLPHTHNSKRNGFVTDLVKLILNDKTLLQTISLQSLAQFYGFDITQYQTLQKKKAQQEEKYKQRKDQPIPTNTTTTQSCNFESTAKKRMLFLEWLVDNRNGDCSGYRDVILHHHHNAAILCMSISDAETRTYALNDCFREPLSHKDIKTQIFRPIHHTTNGQGYKYKGSTILTAVGATAAERQYFLEGKSARDQERQQAREAKQTTKALIIAYRNNGMTYQEIAEKTGKSIRTIKSICTPTAKSDKLERNTKILQLSASGKSTRQIAEELNISDKTVRTVINETRTNDTTTTERFHKPSTVWKEFTSKKPERAQQPFMTSTTTETPIPKGKCKGTKSPPPPQNQTSPYIPPLGSSSYI